MMWIIEKYLKYLSIFVALWAGLILYRNFSCAKVFSNGMVPTLTDEEFQAIYNYNEREVRQKVKTGDIVYYRRAIGTERNEYYFGRVIATEGHLVSIMRGEVFVDDKPLPETYVDKANRLPAEQFTSIVVPRDHFFIANDNRAAHHLKDSRSFGPISVHAILGKATNK
ncbi:MAG: signal peptidase I [Planctomycetes bacterium]|nr:signal peptidase I [Planctomycetota bacterium]